MTRGTSRRSFLHGLFCAPAIVAASSIMPVKAILDVPPRLWGDGVHDDTAALQWILDRPGAYIVNGVYRVTAPLIVRHDYTTIDGVRFKLGDHNVAGGMVVRQDVQNVLLTNISWSWPDA